VRNGRAREDKGVAALEFALVLPMLLLLVFGTIEYGWMINRETNLNHAAREGAREGIFNSSDVEIENRVRAASAHLDQSLLTVTVECRKADDTACPGASFPAEWESGGTVMVTVDYDYSFMTPVPELVGVSPTRTLTSTVEMRIE